MGVVFISYSSKNRDSADAVREIFRKHGIKSWMAPYDIPAGHVYADVIIDALKNCSCVVLLLTSSALGSQWVSKELERAVSYNKSIISIRMEDVVIKGKFELYLSDEQMVEIPRIDENNVEMKKVIDAAKVFIGTKEEPLKKDDKSNIEEKVVSDKNVPKSRKNRHNPLSEPLLVTLRAAEKTFKSLTEKKDELPQKFVYLSYCSMDLMYPEFKKRYTKFTKELEKRGIITWCSDNIKPGQDYNVVLPQAIKDCCVFVAFMTKNYVMSAEANNEILFAKEHKKPVVPLMANKLELDAMWRYIIKAYQVIDFTETEDAKIISVAERIAKQINSM